MTETGLSCSGARILVIRDPSLPCKLKAKLNLKISNYHRHGSLAKYIADFTVILS